MKNQKGITLIALVITIIVLLILAGVSIAMLTGENGILNQAKSSKTETVKAEAIEKINLTLDAIKAKVYEEQVTNTTYTGIVSNALDGTSTTGLVGVIMKDLGSDTTNTGTAVDGKYDYSLDGTTLTISYVNSVAEVPEIAGTIELDGSEMEISGAAVVPGE